MAGTAPQLPKLPAPPGTTPATGSRASQRWRRVLRATLASSVSDRVSMTAAGCAFYATLALFPTISILISIYGLLANPSNVETQLQVLQSVLPPQAFELILERVHHLVALPRARLSVELAISTVVSFWSAATGTKAVIVAINLAFGERERRGVLRFQLVGFGLTLSAIMSAVLGITVLVLLPAWLRLLGIARYETRLQLLHALSLTMLVGFAALSIALLYRLGPSQRPPHGRPVIPGVLLATLVWLIASGLLDFYIAHMGSFGATYGPIGAVVGVMLWFFLTVYAILLGAELNAQLERRRH